MEYEQYLQYDNLFSSSADYNFSQYNGDKDDIFFIRPENELDGYKNTYKTETEFIENFMRIDHHKSLYRYNYFNLFTLFIMI
jgi:hypothetical protein